MFRFYPYILLFFLIPPSLFPQDSTISAKDLKDSLINKDTLSVSLDTLTEVTSDVRSPIIYSAKDSAVFDLKTNKLFLYNHSILTYEDLKLNAGIISVDKETKILNARGIPDSLDSQNLVQLPVMFQGDSKYESSVLNYNFGSQQGVISNGYSDADVGYYYGEKIKKVTSEVYFIKNGLYTTSTDKTDPEYYFLSPKMKIIPQDKVVAQSVFLYIEGVPVFWIPFGVFPNKQGRSSGLIAPTYGKDGTYGTYIAKLGYFLALSDYYDIAATGSWFSRGRIDFNSRFRYAFRYKFSGSIEGGYSRIRLGEDTDPDKFSSDAWAFFLTHSQAFNPSTRIDANLQFVSGKSYYDNSTNNLNQLLQQNIISNVTFSKSWEGKPFQLTANYYRDQNLVNGSISERLPALNFSISQTYPFQSDISHSDNKKLYEYFYYSYNGALLNSRVKQTVTNSLGIDSIYRNNRAGLRQDVSMNVAPQYTFFNLSLFANYTELWYNKSIVKTFNSSDSSVLVTDVDGFKAARYFNTGASINTKLIGIFTPNILGIKGIRHTISPALTYIYTPDFSVPGWGYYGTYNDVTGKQVKYSFFEREVFGSPPQGEVQALNFTVGNLFEVKVKDTDSTDTKFQLFNIDAGLSYNFAADSLKFSEIFTNFRTSIGGYLSIGGNATFNLYRFDPITGSRINTFLINSGGGLAQLTAFNISMSSNFNFNIGHTGVLTDTIKKEVKTITDEVNYSLPISGGLNFNYSENRSNPISVLRNSNIGGNLVINPTEKWRFGFSAGYDVLNKQFTAPYITAYRDLNSWEMNLNWYPAGIYSGFNLEVRIKAPALKDIKVTKQSNNRGAF
ncbi:putative LPS assembly protein LptD [soil metagenome]